MKTKKITPLGKILIFLIAVVVVFSGVYFVGGFNFLKKKDVSQQTITNNNKTIKMSNTSQDNTINLSIDEKLSWKPILDANGGLSTRSGSIYDKLGLKVNINIVNNETGVKNFISGQTNAFANSINGYAAMYKKFKDAGVNSVMPYIVDNSNGGDGIIVRGNINSAADFVGKKIGVPDMSSDQTILLWLLAKSDISSDQFNQIKNNMKVYSSVGDTSNGFFNGEVDIAGVRQPYLTKAKNSSGTKVLFTTKNGKNLIANGIIFRKDFIDKNPDIVKNFIDGALQALDQVNTFDNVRAEPSFKNSTDAELKQMMTETSFNDYTGNVNFLNGMAQSLFEDMSNVWGSVGVDVVHNESQNAFTKSFIDNLSNKYSIKSTTTNKVNDTQKQKAQSQDDNQALLKKSTTINFKPNSAKFLDETQASKSIDEFVGIAKFLDGAIIQIEGNISDTGEGDTKAGRLLSYQRAKAVANYLQQHSIDSSRFVVIGNGTSKQIGDNHTKAGMKKNRRTDIFFKVIE